MAEWKQQTITLLHPVKVGEVSISTLTLKEPDVDALQVIEEQGFQVGKAPTIKQLRAVIAALSGQPTEMIGKMHRDDFDKSGEAALPLFAGASDGAAGTESDPPAITTPSSGTLPTT